MADLEISLLNDFVAALFCGAFIGIERERGKLAPEPAAADRPESQNLAGIRTHSLVAILGATARFLDRDAARPGGFTGIAFAALALFVVTAHGVRAARTGRYGMTSVPTLLLTFVLGVLCLSGQRPLALALAVVITATLAFKAPIHSFVRALNAAEVTAAVKFGLLALVLLPILPDHAFGPADWPRLAEQLRELGMSDEALAQFALFNPYQLWFMVVAISGIGFVGYVLMRVLGPGRGLVVTGLTGGLVSSTSVTLAMAEQSRRTPMWKDAIAVAVLAACTVMAARVLIVAVAIHPRLLAWLGPIVGLMLVASVVVTLSLSRQARAARTEGTLAVATPLAIVPALKLAGLILLVRVLSTVAMLAIGDAGLVVMAAISGLVDVDAITIATSQQAVAGQVSERLATIAILTAVASNTVVKGVLILVTGDRATGKRTFAALMITLAAAAAGLAIGHFAGLAPDRMGTPGG